MTTPRVSFGMIVLNGMPWLEYNLRALYPFAHEILVVEGACEAAHRMATADGHSTDGTLEALRQFASQEDPEDKLQIITKAGFWSEKDEMSQAYAARATGDWLWQIDVDEFYRDEDMHRVLELLAKDPGVSGASFPFIQFWGGFWYRENGRWFLIEYLSQDRLFRWGRGYRYTSHRPPTVVDAEGRELRQQCWLTHKQMRRKGIYIYHYSYVLPKQAEEKVAYYSHVNWTDAFRKNQRWLERSYCRLEDPLYIGEFGRAMPDWLERYDGQHPSAIRQLMADIESGRARCLLRPTDDIEALLANRSFRFKRFFMKLGVLLMGAIRRVARMIGWRVHLARRWLAQLRETKAETPSQQGP